MPLYEFRCQTCGEFETWRTMAEATEPMPCPQCQTAAQRIFSAPNISLNTGNLSKYTKEPRRVKPDRSSEKPTPKYTGQKNGRPWMISH